MLIFCQEILCTEALMKTLYEIWNLLLMKKNEFIAIFLLGFEIKKIVYFQIFQLYI